MPLNRLRRANGARASPFRPIPFRYVEAELVIKDTVQRLAELANAPTSKRIGNRFLEEGQKLESSLRTMLEGLNEGEIFQHARDSTKVKIPKDRWPNFKGTQQSTTRHVFLGSATRASSASAPTTPRS